MDSWDRVLFNIKQAYELFNIGALTEEQFLDIKRGIIYEKTEEQADLTVTPTEVFSSKTRTSDASTSTIPPQVVEKDSLNDIQWEANKPPKHFNQDFERVNVAEK